MKVSYIISWIVCSIQLGMFVLIGGIVPFLTMVQQGFYRTLYDRSLSAGESGSFLLLFNRFAGIVYVAAVVIGIGSILLYKTDKKIQYLTGIICGSITILVLFLPKVIALFY